MRMLLTGGAGYVGSACLRWLLSHGHDPIAYDNLSEGNAAAVPEGRLIEGDLADKDAIARAIREHDAELVMHFAAVASVPDSIAQPDLYWQTNLVGTKNVLDAMRETGVDRVIVSSTAATYKFDVEMPITETTPTEPQVPYGTTKLASEWLVQEYSKAYGIGYGILRYFNASGADIDGEFGEDRRKESHLIPLVLYAAVGKRDKVLVFGGDWDTRDGSCVRDYVHTDDLGSAHQAVAESIVPGKGEVYNIGSGTGTTVLEVIAACEKVAGKPIPHEVVGPRDGDPAVLVASSQKLQDQLGWKPQHDIEKIVESAWVWHERYPNGYRSKS